MSGGEKTPEGVGIPLTQKEVAATKKRISAWAWRVFRPVFDSAACKQCWACYDYCPEGVISKSDDGPVVNLETCKGCGVCATECRFDAIKMEREGER